MQLVADRTGGGVLRGGGRRVTTAVAVVLASAATGIVLVALAAASHPVVVVLLPVGVLAALAALQRPWIAAAAVVAAVPLAVVEARVGPFDLIDVVVLGAAGVTALHRLASRQAPLPWPRVTWWPAAIGLLAIASATRAPDLGVAVGQVLLLLLGGFAFLTVVGALDDAADVRRVAAVWCVTGIGVSLHALTGAGQLAATSGGLTVAGRPTGIFDSPNQLGAYAAMTVLVGLGLSLPARLGWLRLLGVLTVVLAAGALGLSLSRGAWVGGGVAGLVFIAALPAARRMFGRLVVPVVSVAVLGVGVLLPEPPPQLAVVNQRFETLAAGETSPYDTRDVIYAEAIRQAGDAPLLGQGPANFPEVSQRAVSESSFVGADHAHNTVLNTAAEFGVPATLLLIGFAVSLLRTARRATRRLGRLEDRALAAAVGAALVVQVVHGLIDYTLRNATIAILTWVTAGLVVALARTARVPDGCAPRQPPSSSRSAPMTGLGRASVSSRP